MASKSLGTLTIDLVAKVGGFVSGMDKAERASDKWRKQVQKNVEGASKALAGMAAGVAAAGTAVGIAGYQLLKSTSQQITETDRWAKSLNMSTQELLAWQFAAEKAGLSADNMADIFKDLGDKIGDAVLNQSGEAVDALNALGLSAEKLSKVSPDKQMLAIGEALGKISTNAGKITILESMGNDLSKMLPLFENNNEKLKQFIQLSKDYGVAPDPDSIDDLVKVNTLFENMESQVKGLKIEIAAGLAKVDLSPLQGSLDKLQKVLTDPQVLQGIVNLVSEVAELAGWLVRAAASAGDLAVKVSARHQGVFGTFSDSNVPAMQERIKFLQMQADNAKSGGTWLGNLLGSDDSLEHYQTEIAKLQGQIEKVNNSAKGAVKLPLGQATVTVGGGEFSLGVGESNGKPSKPKVPKVSGSAKSLDSAFQSTEKNYLRQIALIDITGKKSEKVSEAESLRFDLASGKLVGINEKQQKRLLQLANELDKLNALKKANEENIKLAEFSANLRSANDNDRLSLSSDFVGAGMGQKTRDRMKELLGIQQDFLNQQRDLQSQYQSGDITKSLYDKEAEALKRALSERLKIQEDYYKQSDEQKNDWSSGLSDALTDFADHASDYYQQAADAMTSIMGAATDSISSHLYDVLSGTESLGEAMKGVFADLGQAVIKALVDMAAQWLAYQAVQLLVDKTTQASAVPAMIANAQATALQAQLAAFASTAAVPIVGPAMAPAAMAAAAAVTTPMVAAIGASALSGMAHDGIESVPETGTWLLQKGERVTTAKTSAKLDATLDRVGKQSVSGVMPVNNIVVNGDPDKSTIRAIEEAVARGEKRVYGRVTGDVATGRGDMSKALMAGWNTKRRAS